MWEQAQRPISKNSRLKWKPAPLMMKSAERSTTRGGWNDQTMASVATKKDPNLFEQAILKNW